MYNWEVTKIDIFMIRLFHIFNLITMMKWLGWLIWLINSHDYINPIKPYVDENSMSFSSQPKIPWLEEKRPSQKRTNISCQKELVKLFRRHSQSLTLSKLIILVKKIEKPWSDNLVQHKPPKILKCKWAKIDRRTKLYSWFDHQLCFSRWYINLTSWIYHQWNQFSQKPLAKASR